jgi:hypothetical protein
MNDERHCESKQAPVSRAPSSSRLRRTPLRSEGRVEPGPMGSSAIGPSSTWEKPGADVGFLQLAVRWTRWGRVGALGALIWGNGCLDRPIGSVAPVTTNVFVESITQTSVDKIDLLLMIDNSASMSDKQAILRLAVPDLVQRLVNPGCIDAAGTRGAAPAPDEACPRGQTREFNPVRDIHVAIVSSSLGDAGANDACSSEGVAPPVPDSVDLAHLVGSLPRGAGTASSPAGFLEWRAGSTNESEFSASFERMVQSVGEKGCGWEASLESWYRFLVDPAPYRELVRVACPGARAGDRSCVQPSTDGEGHIIVDQVLLDQRAAFLRPDSLVAVIMLSDENDCSLQVGGSNWVVADTRRRMNRASSACDQDPNDACCYMCGLQPPNGCSADPVCDVAPEPSLVGRLTAEADGSNLRCFDQKRRFGYDFLYPTSRYVRALTEYTLCLAHPDLSLEGCPAELRVQNPLFSGGRERSSVFLGGIVGVPWQAIASPVDSSGQSLPDPDTTLRFKTALELDADDTWSDILGSPDGAGALPENPAMIESPFPRPGVDSGNAENGREYRTEGKGPYAGVPLDLEYACISPLPEPRDCSKLNRRDDQCDCFDGDFDRPLCERNPGVDAPGTTQYWAKAYPGTRQLEVLRDYGDNSIVASICARNVDIRTSDTRPDFGYRPAVDAIVERLKDKLTDRCLPRALSPAQDGTVPCTLVETVPEPDGACVCDPTTARRVPDERTSSLIRAELMRDRGRGCGASDPTCEKACLCEVLQVQQVPGQDPESALRECQQEPDDGVSGVEGWCYVANTETQHIGNPEIVAGCPSTERQLLRFVGQRLAADSTTFIACQGSSLAAQVAP